MPLKSDVGQNCPFNRVLRTGSQRPQCEGWGRWLMSHDGGNVWHIIQTIKMSENLSSSQHVSQIKWMTSVCFRSFFPLTLVCVCVCVCSQFLNRRFGRRSVIYSNKIQAENHSKKTVSDGSVTTEPYVENSSSVKKVWKKSSCIWDDCILHPCSKWEMNFTHHDFVFSLSLLPEWNHAFCISGS